MKRIIAGMIMSCLITASLVLASCGPATTDEKEEVTPEEGSQYGGHLRYAWYGKPIALDPHVGQGGYDAYYWRQMYDQLVGADAQLVSQPELSLAESWELPDDTTMIFHLRKGVKFHDGTDFNAEAVKFNIERVLDPDVKAPPRSSFMVIESVEIVDDYTVKLHLKTPWGAGLGMIADRGGCMNSPTAVQQLGEEYGFNPVGTGPFKFVEFVTDSHCKMVKNEDYWGKDAAGNSLPFLDELTIFLIVDEAVRSAALETGEVDVAYLPMKDIGKFEANPDISIAKRAGGVLASLSFNLASPPMDNVYLRQALAYSVNPSAINEAIYFGRGIVADAGHWSPGCWVYDNTVPRPYYDPEKAREYLKLGGYPDGFEMNFLGYTNPASTQVVEMVQAQAAEVNIKLNVTILEGSKIVGAHFSGPSEFPLYEVGLSHYPEPDWVGSKLYKSDAYINAGKLPNPRIDALIEKAASLYDIEERKAVYREITETTVTECWWFAILYNVNYHGYWNAVRGMDTLYGWDAKPQFKEIWLKP